MQRIHLFFLTLLMSWQLTHSAVASSPIVIGLDADMSAVAVEGGFAIQRGAQIAIDEINAAGGVLGRPLALKVRDHRGNPARGLANINYFAKDPNVVAVLGGVHTPVALHELPAIHQQQLIYLGPWAAGTPIVDNDYDPNYVFRLSLRDEHAGLILVQEAQRRQLPKVALLLERTGWGRSNEKSMKAAADKLGLSVTTTEWFNWREQSLRSQLDKIIESGADAVLLVANAPEGAQAVRDMAALRKNKRIPILSHWGIASGAFVEMTGTNNIAAVDLSVLQTYSFLAPKYPERMQALLSAYQKQFDPQVTAETIPAGVGVVHAYDLVHLLTMAITKAGTINRPKVRDALESLERYEGVFKNFETPFSVEKHDALTYSDYIMTTYNQNGYLVPVKQ